MWHPHTPMIPSRRSPAPAPACFYSVRPSYRLPVVSDATAQETVKIRANSPGRYPILVVELAGGELRTAYFETGYDLGRAKKVEEVWLRENALGRHSFVEADPPREVPASALRDYVRRELLRAD
jgi:hypothetical protein